jgi:flagellar protein FliO/FliZ
MFDLDTYLRFAAALAAVLALILGLAWIARRRQALSGGGGGLRARRRLAVLETAALDARTRLALVRCDEREYLLAVGPHGVTPIPGPAPAAPAGLPESVAR